MKCLFKNNLSRAHCKIKAFTLVEVITALVVLALFSSSVLVVINRCMAAAADSELKSKAFEVARENMEMLLTMESVFETVEYGVSDRYPEIEWQTTIESFSEPSSSRSWVSAVCTANYIDAQGEEQEVELTNWLICLSDAEAGKLMENKFAKDINEAALYAGVDEETIQKWVDNGMPVNFDGSYSKDELDFYKLHGGNPTAEAAKQHAAESKTSKEQGQQEGKQDTADKSNEGDKKSPPKKQKMTPEQFRELINSIMKKFQR